MRRDVHKATVLLFPSWSGIVRWVKRAILQNDKRDVCSSLERLLKTPIRDLVIRANIVHDVKGDMLHFGR